MPSPSPYERIRDEHLAAFPGTVTGGLTATACVVSERVLPDTARNALAASLERRGHQTRQIAFITLEGEGDAAASPSELFRAIEALDPLCVVVTDLHSVQAASRGYNTPLALEADAQLLGRACRCFEDFPALLADDAGKRRAWAALKTLPER